MKTYYIELGNKQLKYRSYKKALQMHEQLLAKGKEAFFAYSENGKIYEAVSGRLIDIDFYLMECRRLFKAQIQAQLKFIQLIQKQARGKGVSEEEILLDFVNLLPDKQARPTSHRTRKKTG